MKNLKKVAMTGLQVASAISALASVAAQAHQENSNKATQAELNQASLKSIEESWLAVPRSCKAAAFNAQPNPLAYEMRSESVKALYSSFFV